MPPLITQTTFAMNLRIQHFITFADIESESLCPVNSFRSIHCGPDLSLIIFDCRDLNHFVQIFPQAHVNTVNVPPHVSASLSLCLPNMDLAASISPKWFFWLLPMMFQHNLFHQYYYTHFKKTNENRNILMSLNNQPASLHINGQIHQESSSVS